MADSTPPPGHEWQVRTDAGARKVVERIDAVRSEVASLHQEVAVMKALQAGNITHRGALAASLGVLAVAGGLGLFFLGKAEAAADRAGSPALVVAQRAEATAQRAEAKADAQERFLKTELADMKHEFRADMSELKDVVRNATRAVERTAKRAAVAVDGGP